MFRWFTAWRARRQVARRLKITTAAVDIDSGRIIRALRDKETKKRGERPPQKDRRS